MRRWQNCRAVGGEDVRNSHLLCYRPSGDLQGRRSRDNVAAPGGGGDCLELGRDRDFGQLTPARRRLFRGRCRTRVRTDGHYGAIETVDPVAEVGRGAQADLLTERSQLRRQCHQRLDIAPRTSSVRRIDTRTTSAKRAASVLSNGTKRIPRGCAPRRTSALLTEGSVLTEETVEPLLEATEQDIQALSFEVPGVRVTIRK